MKDLVRRIYFFIQVSGVDGGGDFMQCEVFQLLPKGSEAKSWGIIRAFKYVRSQLIAKIFLAPDHTGGIHNALVMQEQA